MQTLKTYAEKGLMITRDSKKEVGEAPSLFIEILEKNGVHARTHVIIFFLSFFSFLMVREIYYFGTRKILLWYEKNTTLVREAFDNTYLQ